MCSHHFVPFYGTGTCLHPNERSSALEAPRLLEFFAGAQLQGGSRSSAGVLEEELKRRVMVVIEHVTSASRCGREEAGRDVTSAIRGSS